MAVGGSTNSCADRRMTFMVDFSPTRGASVSSKSDEP